MSSLPLIESVSLLGTRLELVQEQGRSFTFEAPMDPGMTPPPLALSETRFRDLTYAFSRTLTGTETGGVAVVSITVSDVVNNQTTDNSAGISTDFTPPEFTAITVPPSPANVGTLVTVEFTTSETLPSNPVVTLGTQPATFVSLSASRYTFRRTLTGTETEGTAEIRISGSDAAGNAGLSTSSTIEVDFTAPVFSALSRSPAIAVVPERSWTWASRFLKPLSRHPTWPWDPRQEIGRAHV